MEFSITEQQYGTTSRAKGIDTIQQVWNFQRRISFREGHRGEAEEAGRHRVFFFQLSAELLDRRGQQPFMDCRMSGIQVFEGSWREHD
jgi:hypothetical protein